MNVTEECVRSTGDCRGTNEHGMFEISFFRGP